VSFVNTGHWGMAYAHLYGAVDTATVGGRMVSGEPPGMSVLLIPVYLVWRVFAGPVDTLNGFRAFNAFAALAVGSTASAPLTIQASWLAG